MKQKLYSFKMVKLKSIVKQLMEFYLTTDDLVNFEVNLEDEDKTLRLLRLLPRSFEPF
jgi:hypothetical protein